MLIFIDIKRGWEGKAENRGLAEISRFFELSRNFDIGISQPSAGRGAGKGIILLPVKQG
jgi:hypothetical protein